MLLDARDLEAGQELSCDICVIGGGAAGITLARSLIGSGIDVCLLESGGVVPDAQTQNLGLGESVGLLPASNLMECRLRFLGGSTNHWGGWSAPFSEHDFEERPWIEHSGWPFPRSELMPYYEQALDVCALGSFTFAREDWPQGRELPDFQAEKLSATIWHLGSPPVRFGSAYRAELEAAANVRLILRANVARLEASENGRRVENARIQTPEGGSATVRGRRFVIACGGIENARLLLLSDRPDPSGLGNEHDLVGRFFMQHPHVLAGMVLAREPRGFGYLFNRREAGPTFQTLPCLTPPHEFQRREAILAVGATIETTPDDDSGYVALRHIGRSLKRRSWPDDLTEDLQAVLRDLRGAAQGASDLLDDVWAPPPLRIDLRTRSEQQPDPDSRVTLADARDELGLRRARMDWRLGELDKRSVRITAQLVAEEVGRLDLGRVKLADWLLEDDSSWPDDLWGGCHHMGTTRMSDDPRKGVVDRDCRVHGVENLYVAGSSVFPTSSHANPTFTIVALALRLGAHLRTQRA